MDKKPTEDEVPVAASGQDKAGKGGKSRAPVDIDLPASAVTDLGTARPPDQPTVEPDVAKPEPATAPPPPVKSPKLVPAMLGLVAGFVGGFGAWQVLGLQGTGPDTVAKALGERLARLESVRPAVPAADLAERLTRAETSAREAGVRDTAIRAEITRLSEALGAEQAERAKALANLAERSGPAPVVIQTPAGSVGELTPELERLRARLSALESATKALPEAIGAVAARNEAASSKVEALLPRLDEMTQRVESYAPRLTSVTEQMAGLSRTVSGVATRDELSRAAALLLSVNVLSEAFQRHETLGALLPTLRGLGVSDTLLSPLEPFAATAPPTPVSLQAELRRLAAPPVATASPAGDLFERLKQGAASLVDVRRTGEITGTDDAAHLARAEQALQRGDLAMALALTGRLTAERAPAFAEWRKRLQTRVSAQDSLGKIREESLARLSRAAGSAKQ